MTSSRRNPQHQGPRRARDAPQLSSSNSSARPKPPKKVPSEILSDDIVIMLIGRVGSGRSTFINALLPPDTPDTMEVSSTLDECTKEVKHTVIDIEALSHPQRLGEGATRRLVLVDTPGLDANGQHDSAVFQKLANWSGRWIPRGGCRGGVVILHDITARQRLGAPDIATLAQHFAVVVGTTKWKYLAGRNGGNLHDELVALWNSLDKGQFHKLQEHTNRWEPVKAVVKAAERRHKVDFRGAFESMLPGKRTEESVYTEGRNRVEAEVKESLGRAIANMFRRFFGRPEKKGDGKKR